MKTPQQIEEMARIHALNSKQYIAILHTNQTVRDEKEASYIEGATQMQKELLEELKSLCTYNSTAIGRQAECYIKVMPTLLEILDKHGIGVFLRGIVYRSYTQAQKDLLESASGGKEEAWVNYRKGEGHSYGHKEALEYGWQACALSKMKELQEKDEEINKLKNFPLNGVVCECITDCDCILKMKEKYQEVVKDIEYLTFKIKGHLTIDALEELNDKIRTKYGLDKKEG